MNFNAHDFSLRQLQYALAVLDTGGFRKAAAVCHVSQPALSAQLAALERVLGTALFERSASGVLPTAAGLQVLAQARTVLGQAEELVQLTRRLGDPLASTLRLGVIPTLAPYVVPALLTPLHKEFPQLKLQWLEERTSRLKEELIRNGIDAAVVALEADLGDIAWEALGKDPFLLAVPKAHPLARHKGPVTRATLEGEALLLLDEGHCLREQALSFCGSPSTDGQGVRATSLTTLVQMVLGGLGVTLLPQLAAKAEDRRSQLALLPFVDPPPGRTIALVWRANSPLSKAYRTLGRAMAKTLGPMLESVA